MRSLNCILNVLGAHSVSYVGMSKSRANLLERGADIGYYRVELTDLPFRPFNKFSAATSLNGYTQQSAVGDSTLLCKCTAGYDIKIRYQNPPSLLHRVLTTDLGFHNTKNRANLNEFLVITRTTQKALVAENESEWVVCIAKKYIHLGPPSEDRDNGRVWKYSNRTVGQVPHLWLSAPLFRGEIQVRPSVQKCPFGLIEKRNYRAKTFSSV